MMAELVNPLSEMETPILLFQLLSADNVDDTLNGVSSILLGDTWDLAKQAEDWLYYWGGMTPLIHIADPKNRKYWLKDYTTAYLERDLSDLANLSDLKPFRKFQQIAALRSANLLSYSELSKDTGIGIETARRYLEYLRISYQAMSIAINPMSQKR
jgi:predicted AAA+ superfamily ATPase